MLTSPSGNPPTTPATYWLSVARSKVPKSSGLAPVEVPVTNISRLSRTPLKYSSVPPTKFPSTSNSVFEPNTSEALSSP